MNSANTVPQRDMGIAYLLLRATLGLNIFMHGISRLVAGTSIFAGIAGSTVPKDVLACLVGVCVWT